MEETVVSVEMFMKLKDKEIYDKENTDKLMSSIRHSNKQKVSSKNWNKDWILIKPDVIYYCHLKPSFKNQKFLWFKQTL